MRHESFWTRVEAVIFSWNERKLFFEQSVSVSPDVLHLIAGVVILLVSALLLRKPVSSRWPWLVVLLFTCLNEAIDLWISQWPSPGVQFGESAKDVVLTMLLPTVLLVTARKLPQLYRPESRPEQARAPGTDGEVGPV